MLHTASQNLDDNGFEGLALVIVKACGVGKDARMMKVGNRTHLVRKPEIQEEHSYPLLVDPRLQAVLLQYHSRTQVESSFVFFGPKR